MELRATESATKLIESLKKRHGDLIFHLSGGCCDGTGPTCLRAADFTKNANDIELGKICGVPFYLSETQRKIFATTDSFLLIDVVAGYGSGFSLESPEGKCFILRTDSCSTDK